MDIKTVANDLYIAETNTAPVEPLTTTYPGITMEDAYNIQQTGVAMRCKENGRFVVGKKIGLTSLAMQKLLGVDEPDYGHLLDHMLITPGQPIPRSELLLPKVEGEIAFVLKQTLKGPGVTFTDVLRATEGVMAAIEVVDSRVRDWKIKLADTVADNASSARFVLGSRMVPVDKVDLRLVGMVLEKNGGSPEHGGRSRRLGPSRRFRGVARQQTVGVRNRPRSRGSHPLGRAHGCRGRTPGGLFPRRLPGTRQRGSTFHVAARNLHL